MTEDDLLRILRDETRPAETELGALRRSLARRVADQRVSQALLRHLPPVAPGEVDHARSRLRRSRRRRPFPWLAAALGGGVLAGGAALAGAAVVWIGLRMLPAEPERALTGSLAEAAGPVPDLPGVRVAAEGAGELAGTTRQPEIHWTGGRVEVEVEPGQGIALSVVTREATVRVIGTVFSVERDALGTEVEVARGHVEVRCVDGPVHQLLAGARATCLPTTAPGLLARANALKSTHAPPDAILAAVEAGIPLASEPFLGELRALRAETLLRAGEASEALAEARRYLEIGGSRRLEVLQIAAAAAQEAEGCAGALPYLHALEEAGAGDPALLERCEEGP